MRLHHPPAGRTTSSFLAATVFFFTPFPIHAADEVPAPRIAPLTEPPPAAPRRTAVVEVAKRVMPAVVNIHSERTIGAKPRDFDWEFVRTQHRVNGMGTGVIIDPRGYIVTNHHVVDDVQLLRVRLADGSPYSARVVARDPEADIAILKIDVAKPLPTVPLGTAADLMVGEPVIAIGNAFGYENTVTYGVISALKRDVTLNREVSYKQLIQTDASINPGNSGGPLLNVYGELVGVNVAIRAGAQGIGFAIPVDSMLTTAADLLSARRRTGLAHGLVLRDQVDSSSNPVHRWAVIERCEATGPGAKAGLEVGDVLEKVGDVSVICALDLERALLERSPGDKVPVVARRGAESRGEGGREIKGELVLKAPEKTIAAAGGDLVWKKLGLKAAPVAADAVTRVNPQLRGGLSITDIDPNGPAARAGFQRGDILIGLDKWETITTDNIVYVVSHPDLASLSPLRFFLIRSGQLRRGWLPTLD
jgi:serine protease Do